MKKIANPPMRPVTRLVREHSQANTLRLGSMELLVEVRILADDLFRLRISPGSRFSASSWAVAKSDWPPVPAEVQANARRVAIKTSAGSLAINLQSGAWELRDTDGLKLFTAAAGATGFAGAEARVTLSLAERESIFGLGETTGQFNKRGLIREFWNTDVLGHAPAIHPSLRGLYVSIPFALSLREGRAAGIFWDNPARQTWDLGQTRLDRWQMKAASGEIDLYLFLGPTVEQVVARFTELTGRMPLPPRWALGYQQCRYSYRSRARIEEIAATFRRKRIPCDALYLDIHHMHGYRVFTFGKNFPKPAAMMARLARQGFKVLTIVDPGVKEDPKFGVLKRGAAHSAFVKAPDGKSDYAGEVWPGQARFPDFLNARVRNWWGREQAKLLRLGVAGFWNDMNEPANFALPTKTLPPDCRHETDFGPARHREIHNLYGMQMARASREGALRWSAENPVGANPASSAPARPFVITRAGYAGVQRHAMVWTGDNSSVWEHLADSIQMFLNLSLSGVAFCGGDAGGFLDNCTPELFTRWMQFAAFTPFFRNHSNLDTIDQEPWAFGPEVEATCRRYIELRSQLLPYLYGLFVEAHRTGAPIMRPLCWHFQNDPEAVAAGDQFLLGPSLLVAPILRQGATTRSVYLPSGLWFGFWSGEVFRGGGHILADAPLDTLPIYVRAGAIIPTMPVQQFIGEKRGEIITLHVWPGASSEMNWHEDDGSTVAYESGHWHTRRIGHRQKPRSAILTFSEAQGTFPTEVKEWRVILRHTARPKRVTIDGRKVSGQHDPRTGTFAFTFANRGGAMEVRWR